MLNKRHKIDYHTSPANGGYVILIGVLIMGAVAATIATSVLLIGIGSSQSSLVQQQAYQAQSLADACAEIAIAELDADTEYAGETINPFGAGTCVISIAQPCPSSVCTIKATGSVGSVTRKTRVTATVGTGGGGFVPGKGIFTISPATLSYTVIAPTGTPTMTVRDNASPTPNQPATEDLIIAVATKPVIRTNDNRVNVGDPVSLDGSAFHDSGGVGTCATTALPACALGSTSCVDIRWNGSTSWTNSAGNSETKQCNYGTVLVPASSFSGCSMNIPQSPYGEHDLSGIDKGTVINLCGDKRTAENQVFFVEPKITKTTQSCGGETKTVTITGTGFGASKAITLTWEGADVPPDGSSVSPSNRTTDVNGSFTAIVFTLPTTGTQEIGAHDADRNFASNFIPNPCP